MGTIKRVFNYIIKKKYFVLLLVIVLFLSIDCLLFWNSHFKYYLGNTDFFTEVNVLHNFVKGDIFSYTEIFTEYVNLSFLFFVPFYFFYRSESTVFFLHAICLLIGVFPLFKIARKKLSSSFQAFLISILYLSSPIIFFLLKGVMLNRTILAIPLLLFSWYFYEEKRFKLFAISFFFLVFTKMNMFLVTIPMGLFFLVKEKKRRWGCYAIFISIMLILVYILLRVNIIPLEPVYTPQFEHAFGKGFIGEKFYLSPPYVIRRIVSKDRASNIVKFFGSLGFLPLFGYEILILALPKLLELVLRTRPNSFIYSKGISALIALCFISSVYGIKRINGIITKIAKPKTAINIFLTILICFNIVWIVLLQESIEAGLHEYGRGSINEECYLRTDFTYDERLATLEKMGKIVPDSATIATDLSIIGFFAKRDNVKIHDPHKENLSHYSGWEGYFLLNDFLIKCLRKKELDDRPLQQIADVKIEEIEKNKEYRKILEENGFILFKKRVN